jgi:hypothetical protein
MRPFPTTKKSIVLLPTWYATSVRGTTGQPHISGHLNTDPSSPLSNLGPMDQRYKSNPVHKSGPWHPLTLLTRPHTPTIQHTQKSYEHIKYYFKSFHHPKIPPKFSKILHNHKSISISSILYEHIKVRTHRSTHHDKGPACLRGCHV